MQRKFLVGLVGGVVAVGAVGGVATYLLAGTESSTRLEPLDSTNGDGHKVLEAAKVDGRVVGN